jgi:hypothetical protein
MNGIHGKASLPIHALNFFFRVDDRVFGNLGIGDPGIVELMPKVKRRLPRPISASDSGFSRNQVIRHCPAGRRVRRISRRQFPTSAGSMWVKTEVTKTCCARQK